MTEKTKTEDTDNYFQRLKEEAFKVWPISCRICGSKENLSHFTDEEQKITDVWYFPYTYCCSVCRKDLHLYKEKRSKLLEELNEELDKEFGPRTFDVIELPNGLRTMVKRENNEK